MAASFFFPRPITTTGDLEDLYNTYGVDRAVKLELASPLETPETVRDGYCGAYLAYFQSCGLSFPILESVLEIFAELGLSFTQACPNLLRHLVALLAVPYRDELWRERFFVFKIDQASVGSFDFSKLSRSWAGEIARSGPPYDPSQLRGLLSVLRRGDVSWTSFGGPKIRVAFLFPRGETTAPLIDDDEEAGLPEARATPRLVVVRSRAASGSSRDLTLRSGVIDATTSEGTPILLSSGPEDELSPPQSKHRRVSHVSPFDSAPPSPRRSTLLGPRFVHEGVGPLTASGDDLLYLARAVRPEGVAPLLLSSPAERTAYTKIVAASFSAIEACNELVAATEHHIGDSRRDAEIESIGLDLKRLSAELETAKLEGAKDARKIVGLIKDWERARRESATLAAEVNGQRYRIVDLELERDRDIRRAFWAARCDVVHRYSEILSRLKGKWASKEKETSARIHL
ncbi:hypothetical protein F2Q69_00050296 [Brassica cretica]|uniref:Uncharacterized protein n=1 Tax=Brassica cretica TaxID=69181 RepID=A0A8S9Q160_BRACR|nr:hypothetical protein F2Q69_00050296 [Brassica cretica]